MAKVSIIVPVYNVEKYIEKCLTSLVEQTLEDIEIIVVNDGSSDGSQKVIDRFQEKYPNKIRTIIKENGGQGSARNKGLEIATGEYIGYVDSDDYVETNMFEKMYNNAITNDSDIVIAGNYVVTENGKVIKQEVFKCSKNVTTIDETRDILFDKMGPCNKIYRTTILKSKDIQFRCNKWYEDFDFTVKVLLSANKISIIEEPLYYYLLRKGSTMNNSNIKRNLEILEAMDEIIEFCKKKNIYEKYKEEIEFLAILHIYLPTNVRIIKSEGEKQLKKSMICNINNYMNNTFKDYKKNKHIKQKLSYNKKIIFILMNCRLYNMIKLIFKIYHRY